MEDRRKIKRRYLLYYVRVYDAGSRQLLGNLVDITPTGAMIISESPVTENKDLHLRIELSADVADKAYMDLIVKTIWCHPDIDPSLYNIGFKIVGVSPEDTKIIQNIVETYGFRDNKPLR
jgi:hypothetical protein